MFIPISFPFFVVVNINYIDYEKYQDHFCVCFIDGHLFVCGERVGDSLHSGY